MKIKFLMMPVAVIISIVMIIWHIWPGIFDEGDDNSIISLRKSIAQEKSEVKAIKNRKTNINLLSESLSKQGDTGSLVNGYFPKNRREEDILNKINHIAFSSGVYINKIDFSYGIVNKKDLSEKLAIPKKVLATTVSAENKNIKTKIVSKSKTKTDTTLAKVIGLKMNIFGNYKQTKEFLNSLYLIGMLGNVESFEIKKSENNDNKNNEEEKQVSDNLLMSDVAVNFGYQQEKKVNLTSLMDISLFKTSKFDFDVINEYKNLVMEKYPNSEEGEIGETDPFYPNKS